MAALLTLGLAAQAPTQPRGLEINAFQRALPAPGDTVPATARIQYPQALAWDTQTREIHAKDGEQSVDFRFALTNAWTNAVTITGTKTSCGCTVARLPETPWLIQPGKGGEIQITDALMKQAQNGCVLAYKFEGLRFDCGGAEGYIDATNFCYEQLYLKGL